MSDVEEVYFPETPQPRRRNRRRFYASRPSPHAHWAWIMGLFGGLVLLAAILLYTGNAFFWPVLWIGNSVVFFSVLYGVIRSATR